MFLKKVFNFAPKKYLNFYFILFSPATGRPGEEGGYSGGDGGVCPGGGEAVRLVLKECTLSKYIVMVVKWLELDINLVCQIYLIEGQSNHFLNWSQKRPIRECLIISICLK